MSGNARGGKHLRMQPERLASLGNLGVISDEELVHQDLVRMFARHLWGREGAIVSTGMQISSGWFAATCENVHENAHENAWSRGESSMAFDGHLLPSVAIGCHPLPSVAIRGHLRPSEAIRCHPRPSEAISANYLRENLAVWRADVASVHSELDLVLPRDTLT